jgi:hypothetical protein
MPISVERGAGVDTHPEMIHDAIIKSAIVGFTAPFFINLTLNI